MTNVNQLENLPQIQAPDMISQRNDAPFLDVQNYVVKEEVVETENIDSSFGKNT